MFKESTAKHTNKGLRQSNIELLRLIAMMMVLVLHADYQALGIPSRQDLLSATLPSVTRVSWESLSIIAVNVFVLISGYFSIKASLKGLATFLFQILWFYIGIFLVLFILGHTKEFTVTDLLDNENIYWFVRKYLWLYISSPILNYIVTHTTKKVLGLIVISLLILETIIGYIFALWYEFGYSATHFITLYMLARYVHLYLHDINVKITAVVFMTCWICNTVIGVILADSPVIWKYFLNYTNPLVIAQSLALLLLMTKIKLRQSVFINSIAASAFAVYLFHNHVLLFPYFKETIVNTYHTTSSIATLITIFGVLCLWFAAAIIIDIARRHTWNIIMKSINH